MHAFLAIIFTIVTFMIGAFVYFAVRDVNFRRGVSRRTVLLVGLTAVFTLMYWVNLIKA